MSRAQVVIDVLRNGLLVHSVLVRSSFWTIARDKGKDKDMDKDKDSSGGVDNEQCHAQPFGRGAVAGA